MRTRIPELIVIVMWTAASCFAQSGGPPWRAPIASSQELKIGGGAIQVDFANGKLDLPNSALTAWVDKAARAVTAYYGHFPVSRARVLIVPTSGDAIHGTTWGGVGGVAGFTRMRVGTRVSQADLSSDWTMTHELTHLAFPSLPDDHHWMEEGLATYVEPIARAQIGDLSARQVWEGMVSGMPNGEPQSGDQGLDRTHTWGRTYWGGAMFCLVADVMIRRQTDNRKGLQDALRAIVDTGGTIDHDWSLTRALEIGDRATGTTVLSDLYKKWSDAPKEVDLPALWKDLGVQSSANGVTFDDNAPLARIREAITQKG
ncbi:MAG TPA: hypothetical protein VKW78_17380 [Terriglobales bacterium]|nr:hypothetical protein [Terriglobales bacterium]